MDARQELTLFSMIEQSKDMSRIKLWSSLTKLEDVDYMINAES